MSKLGLRLCFVYCLLSLVCVVSAVLAQTDFKSHFVLLQLPIALQGALVDAVGLARYLETLSWPFTYVLLGLPTLAALYVLGMLIEHALKPRY
jgi:hypothetical protein